MSDERKDSSALEPNAPSAQDAAIRARIEQGDLAGATHGALTLYGREVIGFVDGVLDDTRAAHEVYSFVSERVWRGLGCFLWNCSLRIWMYAVARNELARYRTVVIRRAERDVPRSTSQSAAAPFGIPYDVQTLPSKNAIQDLRRQLEPEEREILILRVDRHLSWQDIARTTLGTDAGSHEIDREEALLRQRFRTIKQRLAKAALTTGTFPTR